IMQMTAGHAVAEVLAQLGVRKVIGVVGSCMLEILDGMYGRDDVQFLSTRHEQAAALMADGFARIAGRPGVCIATNGPGATNLLTGVANAFHAQSPVLVITGAPMLKDMFRDSAQEIDQQAIFRPVVKWSAQVRKPEQAAALTWEAYQRTMTGVPGPVHLDLPRDVLNESVEMPDMGRLFRGDVAVPAPDAEAVTAAARLLEKARRPVLLAGGGVLWSEASDDVIALSKHLSAPVMSSTGRDDVAPRSYPLYLGTIGRGALPEAQAFFKQADLVLAVGTSLGHLTTFWRPDFFAPGTRLIHVAQDRNNIGRVYPADVGIQADARVAVKALQRAVKRNGAGRVGWLRKAAAVRAAQDKHRNRAARFDGRPIDPRRAHAALRKVLPKDAIISIDAGVGPGYVYEYQTFERPRSLLAPQGLAAIGIGYPVGLGAKLAAPDRPVVTLSGDGSFLYNGAELETAVREHIPTTCIILNNFNYGSERAYQKFYYDERYIGDAIGNPPFDEYARVFGAAGLRVSEPGELEDAFAEALRLGREQPVLVDVLCTADVFPEPRRKETVKAERLGRA
ncbi:MAG: thiamine pyrophosphate-binding protein, partial [Deltaproteobacteria bacterium]|nr:thiamine pyrophosphate-binding protein [Deltaproteobacteria bacterium]